MTPRLIVYFPLADPAVSADLLMLYVEAGVDVVEFGWPALDPFLDGADVRASMARVAAGDPARALDEALSKLAGRAQAVVMTYGEAEAGAVERADAVLVVAKPGAARRIALEATAKRIATFLPLPLQDEDIEAAAHASFYAMLQAAPGVTGMRATLDLGNAERIGALRAAGVTAPIVLGFGVSTGEHARAAVALGADGIVVGSAALRATLAGRRELAALLKDLRRGLDG